MAVLSRMIDYIYIETLRSPPGMRVIGKCSGESTVKSVILFYTEYDVHTKYKIYYTFTVFSVKYRYCR